MVDWLKGIARKHSSPKLKITVGGPIEEAYSSGRSLWYYVFAAPGTEEGEKALDILELDVDSRIYTFVMSLTDREKTVLTKRIREGKSLSEIAFEMGVKPQSVVSFLDSIREKVKGAFG